MNEKRQSRDTNTKVTYILDLSDKDFKATIIKNASAVLSNRKERTEERINELEGRTVEIP